MDNNLKKHKEIIYFAHREILNLKEKFKNTFLVEQLGIAGSLFTIFTLSFLSMSTMGYYFTPEESEKVSFLPLYSVFAAGLIGTFGTNILINKNKNDAKIAKLEEDIAISQKALMDFHNDELKNSSIEKTIGA